MTRIFFTLGLAFTLLMPLASRCGAQESSRFLNGIAAIVNDDVVTVLEVMTYIGPSLEMAERQYFDRPQVFAQKRQEALEDGINQLVERQLILHDFKTGGYNLPESIIDEEIAREVRERFGDRVTLTKTLQAQGMTYEKFRTQTRDRIIVEAMRSKNVSSGIIISPHKIEVFYATNQTQFALEDQAKLRMIQIKNPANGGAEAARKMANEIASKIKAGASFAEMANVYHEGSQKGGDWGWVEKSVLRKELADVAFKLKAGEMSDVLETTDGFYLMLVEERRMAHVRPLAEVREELEKVLVVQERARVQKKWIDRLKGKSFVRYY
jgi:parvulin-like peptidyl-prolyl isomerase